MTPSAVKIMTLNTGPSSNDKKFMVIDRLINQRDPDIVFLQEVQQPSGLTIPEVGCMELRKKPPSDWTGIKMEKYDSQCSNFHAALMWNKDVFEEAETKNMEELVKKLKKKRKYKNVLNKLQTRSCIVLLKYKSTEEYLLAASWHGPKTKEPERQELVKAFQSFLTALAVENQTEGKGIPIIIGGDFNLNLKAVNVTAKFSKSDAYKITKRKSEKKKKIGIIDYFLFTSSLKVERIEALELNRDHNNYVFLGDENADFTQKQLDSIDHDPVEATMSYVPAATEQPDDEAEDNTEPEITLEELLSLNSLEDVKKHTDLLEFQINNQGPDPNQELSELAEEKLKCANLLLQVFQSKLLQPEII